MNKREVLFLILFTVLAGAVFAADDLCERVLKEGSEEGPGALSIVSSGRDGDVIDRYREGFGIISEVASRLGIRVPPHRAELVPSGQLTVLANIGHYPMPHWHDGSKVIQASQAGGVLEFVDPGCPTCRSFYQDTTPPEQQLSIFMHVIGHNHVATLSQFGAVRQPLDPMAFSLQLSELVSRLYRDVDHDEVSLWIQQLLTVAEMQDYVYGSFDPPSTWIRKPAAWVSQATQRNILGELIGNLNPYAPKIHPHKPTPSVLQFLVENLPPSAPAWKKEVLRLLELTYRPYGSFAQQKILNEGFATFLQWFLPKYTPWRDSRDLVQYGELLWGVAYPRLSNPYWLGNEGWKCLYRRFLAREDIRALNSDEERDTAFIRYADGIIAADTDFDFIYRAFDPQWVLEQELYLKREAGMDEWDYQLPGRQPDHNAQAIVISRDPKKVIAWMAQNVADHSRHWPRVQLVDENGMGRGVAVYEHDVYDNVPLRFREAAKALFVLTQIHEKVVSLRTVASSSWLPTPRPSYWPWYLQPPKPEVTIFPIRIEVTPQGKVRVFEILETTGVLHPLLTERAQDAVTAYEFDLRSSVNDDLSQREEEKFSPRIMTGIVDVILDPSLGIIHHGPGSAEAVLEYTRMVKERMARAVEKALKGEVPILRTQKGVRIRVLPEIPTFKLDSKVAQLLREKLPPAPVDPTLTPRMEIKGIPLAKDNSDLGQGDGSVGDKKWDKKSKDVNGDGDDEGDGDGEEPGDQAGDGAGDPRDIEIPLELWAKLLNEHLELPNTRDLAGKSREVETFRVGARKHPKGNILWDRTIPTALLHSILERLSQGKPPIENVGEQLVEGSRYLTPDDYVVSSSDTDPLPNIKAVVTVVADMSGSMGGRPQELESEFIFYLKMLLAAKYKDVVFRYIGFDTEAHEFSEDEIFRRTLGGGTLYSSGFKLADTILATYSDARWDKYLVGMGDCQTGDDAETMALIREIYPHTRYMTFAAVDAGGWGGVVDQPLALGAKQFASQNEWFGYAHLTAESGSVMRALVELFGKDRPKKK